MVVMIALSIIAALAHESLAQNSSPENALASLIANITDYHSMYSYRVLGTVVPVMSRAARYV